MPKVYLKEKKQYRICYFNKGDEPTILAKDKSTVMLLGGETVGARYIGWNFVSSE